MANQDDDIATLDAARQAADDAYIAARLGKASGKQMQRLDGARKHALLAYMTAVKKSLVHDNAFTQELKAELDKTTQQIKDSLRDIQNLNAFIQNVVKLAQLAGSLALAFA